MSLSSAIRNSDRKAARVLGVTLIRDSAATDAPKTPTSIVHVLRKYFQSVCPVDSGHVVWDVPNPFAPPDPAIARLQAEIARARQFEFVAPHEDDPFGSEDDATNSRDDAFNNEVDAYNSEDDAYDGEGDIFDGEDDIFDDGDDIFDDEDADADVQDDEVEDTPPAPIALPRLLLIPPLSPSPPPPVSSHEKEGSGSPVPWADLAQAYNDIAEAAERAARRAKRDAHRSRLQTLAALGPAASSAL